MAAAQAPDVDFVADAQDSWTGGDDRLWNVDITLTGISEETARDAVFGCRTTLHADVDEHTGELLISLVTVAPDVFRAVAVAVARTREVVGTDVGAAQLRCVNARTRG